MSENPNPRFTWDMPNNSDEDSHIPIEQQEAANNAPQTVEGYWSNAGIIGQHKIQNDSLPPGAMPNMDPSFINETYNQFYNNNSGTPWYSWDKDTQPTGGKQALISLSEMMAPPPDMRPIQGLYVGDEPPQGSSGSYLIDPTIAKDFFQDDAIVAKYKVSEDGKLIIPDTDILRQKAKIEQDTMKAAPEYVPGNVPNTTGGIDQAQFDNMTATERFVQRILPVAGAGVGVLTSAAAGDLPGAARNMAISGAMILGSDPAAMKNMGIPDAAANPIENLMMKVGITLDGPAEFAERVLGMTGQMYYDNAEQLKNFAQTGEFPINMPDNVIEDLKARYRAGGIFYESMNPINPLEQSGALAMRELRRQLIEHPEIPPEQLIGEAKAKFGVQGSVQEFVGHMVLDPLNLMGAFVARLGVKGIKGLSKIAQIEKVADKFPDVVKFAGEAEKLLKPAIQLGKDQPTIVRSVFASKIEATMTKAEAAQLSGLSRWYGGIDATGNAKWLDTTKDATFLQKMFGLTPTSRAVRANARMADTVAAITGGEDFHTMHDMTMKMADTPIPEVAKAFDNPVKVDGEALPSVATGSIAGQSATMALKDFKPKGQALVDAYDMTHGGGPDKSYNPAKIIESVATIIGEKPEQMMNKISRVDGMGEAENKYNQFMYKLKTKADSGDAQATRLLEALTADGDFNPGRLKEYSDLFTKHNVPFSEAQAKAQYNAAMYDHINGWAAKYFGVEPDNALFRFANLIKKAQNPLLLGYNPSYLIQNALSNAVHMAYDGLLGFNKGKTIKARYEEIGFTPSRTKEKMDMHGALEDKGIDAISRAKRATGVIQALTDLLGKIPSPMSKLSGEMEGIQGNQAMYKASMEYLDKLWSAEVYGIDKFSPELAKALGPDVVSAWEGHIKRTMGTKGLVEGQEVGGITLNDVVEPQYHQVLDAFPDLMAKADVELQKATTKEEAAAVIETTLKEALNSYFDEVRKNQETVAELTNNRVQIEGLHAIPDIYGDGASRLEELQIMHFDRMEQTAKDAEAAPDKKIANMIWTASQNRERREFNAEHALYKAEFGGILKAVGLKDDTAVMLMKAIDDTGKLHSDYFERKAARQAEHFGKDYKNKEESQAAWAEVQNLNNSEYESLVIKEAENQASVDVLLTEKVRTQYGDYAAEAFKAYRGNVAMFREIETNAIRYYRSGVNGDKLPPEVKAKIDYIKKSDDFQNAHERTHAFENQVQLPLIYRKTEAAIAGSDWLPGGNKQNVRKPDQTTQWLDPRKVRTSSPSAKEQGAVQRAEQRAADAGAASAGAGTTPRPGAEPGTTPTAGTEPGATTRTGTAGSDVAGAGTRAAANAAGNDTGTANVAGTGVTGQPATPGAPDVTRRGPSTFSELYRWFADIGWTKGTSGAIRAVNKDNGTTYTDWAEVPFDLAEKAIIKHKGNGNTPEENAALAKGLKENDVVAIDDVGNIHTADDVAKMAEAQKVDAEAQKAEVDAAREMLIAEADPTKSVTRDDYAKALVNEFKLPQEQADAVMTVLDGWADYWKERNGITREDWYAENVGKVRSGDIATSGEGQLDQAAEAAGAYTPEQIAEAARLWKEKGTDSPYFKEWFGDWKAIRTRDKLLGMEPVVVDADGKPLVVYHGTTRDFVSFEITQGVRSGFGRLLEKVETPAFFFSDKKDVAQFFAQNRYEYNMDVLPPDKRGSPKTLPVYLSLLNPIDMSKKDAKLINVLMDAGIDLYKKYGVRRDKFGRDGVRTPGNLDASPGEFWKLLDDPKVVDALKAAGYDGAIIQEGTRGGAKAGFGKSYAVFESTQIKSVNNRGTFDPNDPNILRQGGTPEPKGSTNWLENGKAVVTAWKNSDISTSLHETTHVYLKSLVGVADDDIAVVTNWLRETHGMKDLADNWVSGDIETNKQAHELVARALEEYHAEGKAPKGASEQLIKVFEDIKQWMLAIYKQIEGSQIDVQISDEMRALFGKWAMGGDTEGRMNALDAGPVVKEPWQIEGEQSLRDFGYSEEEIAKITYDREHSIDNGQWKLTQKETVENARRQANFVFKKKDIEFAKFAHKNTIEQALKEGKPVPAEVLADYPDLVAKYPQGVAPEVNPNNIEGVTIENNPNESTVNTALLDKNANEKVGKWGYTPTQVEYITANIKDAVNKLGEDETTLAARINYRTDSIEPIIIDVPAGGKIKITSIKGANNLFKSLSGKPLFDEVKPKYSSPINPAQSWTNTRYKAPDLKDPVQAAMAAVRLYVTPENAIEVLRRQLEGEVGNIGDVTPRAIGVLNDVISGKYFEIERITNRGSTYDRNKAVDRNQFIENAAKSRGLFQEGVPEQPLRDRTAPNAVNAPVGSFEDANGDAPHVKATAEGMVKEVLPMLDRAKARLEDPAIQAKLRTRTKIEDLTPELQDKMRAYMAHISDRAAETKLGMKYYAEAKRDFSLLNYSNRYGLDNWLNVIYPYQFWYTRSMMNWGLRTLSKPAILANYARLMQLTRGAEEKPGYPTRLKGKLAVYAPWLPDWMGDTIYIDPYKQIFPFLQITRPWEKMAEDRNIETRKTETNLQEMIANEEITKAQADEAQTLRSGPVWEKSKEMAKAYTGTDTDNPLMLSFGVTGPSLPVGIAANLLTGHPEKISQFPATRTIQNITAMMGLGGNRGVNIEAAVRKATGLPLVDKYEDYRVDRMLANLTAEGDITPKDAIYAQMNRTGPAFEMAQKRVSQIGFLQYSGAVLNADLYPEGEERQRNLMVEYSKAIEAWKNGDKTAIPNFLEKYPEYQARQLSMKNPEERMRSFLRSEIWDRYMGLPDQSKKDAQANFGDLFNDAFLNKDTRSYDSIDTLTYADWARKLGTITPDAIKLPKGMPIKFTDPAITAKIQEYNDTQKKNFPNISTLENVYYGLPVEQQAAFEEQNPELKAHEDWKTQFFADNPEIIPFKISETNAVAGLPNSQQAAVYRYRADKANFYPDIEQKQKAYFAIPAADRNARKAYLKANPAITQYWDWKDKYASEHAIISTYIKGEDAVSKALSGEGVVPANVQRMLDTYYEEKDKRFPDIDLMNEAYYSLTNPAQMKQFAAKYPEVKDYPQWKKMFASSMPEISTYIYEPQTLSNMILPQAQAQAILKKFSPQLSNIILGVIYSGETINAGAKMELQRLWEQDGRPLGDFDRFVNALIMSVQQ